MAPVLGGGGRRWRAIGAMAPVTHHAAPLGRPGGGSARQSRPPGCRLGAAWLEALEAPSTPAGAQGRTPTTWGRHVHHLILAIAWGCCCEMVLRDTILQIPDGHLRLSQPATDRRPPTARLRTAIETSINVPPTAKGSRISGPTRAHLPPRAALLPPASLSLDSSRRSRHPSFVRLLSSCSRPGPLQGGHGPFGRAQCPRPL